jgi:hypothetical protein
MAAQYGAMVKRMHAGRAAQSGRAVPALANGPVRKVESRRAS